MGPIYINIYRDTIHRTDGRKYNISIGQTMSEAADFRLSKEKKEPKKRNFGFQVGLRPSFLMPMCSNNNIKRLWLNN